MNKDQFLKELKKALKRLPKEEVSNIIEYYIEYFLESDIGEDDNVLNIVDTPKSIASEILSDYAFKDLENNNSNPFRSIWFVLLAVTAAPIALPLMLTAVVLLFTMFMVVAVTTFSFYLCSFSFVISGIISIVCSLFTTPLRFFGIISSIGVGLVLIGLGILLFIVTLKLSKKASLGISKISRKLISKIKKTSRED